MATGDCKISVSVLKKGADGVAQKFWVHNRKLDKKQCILGVFSKRSFNT